MSGYEYEPLPREKQLLRLLELGHFHASFDGHATKQNVKGMTTRRKAYTEAVRSYQEYTGLKVDGKIGPKTDTALATNSDALGNRRICNHPDIEPITAAANIPNGTQTWANPEDPILAYVNFTLDGLGTVEQVREGFRQSFRHINSNIGVRLKLTTVKSKAHVLIRRESMTGGTIAYALLHTGDRRPGRHYQAYNTNLVWAMDADDGIALPTISTHEWLHTLGLSHSKRRDSILWPSYQPSVPGMTAYDKLRIRPLYPQFDGDDPAPDEPPKGKQPMSGRFVFGGRPCLFEGVCEWL